MKTKLVENVWHIYTNDKWVKMNPSQLHAKIEILIQESKADKITIIAQAKKLNK